MRSEGPGQVAVIRIRCLGAVETFRYSLLSGHLVQPITSTKSESRPRRIRPEPSFPASAHCGPAASRRHFMGCLQPGCPAMRLCSGYLVEDKDGNGFGRTAGHLQSTISQSF